LAVTRSSTTHTERAVVSTAPMVRQTHHNVTLYLYYMSCRQLKSLYSYIQQNPQVRQYKITFR